MADQIALLIEAERRGILPADKAPLLAEARRRGLVPGNATAEPGIAQLASVNPQMHLPNAQSPAEEPVQAGATATDRVQAAGSGFNAGLAALAGMPVDAVLNVFDLARAGAGVAYHSATGKNIPDALQIGDYRANVPGSTESNRRFMDKSQFTTTQLARPDDTASRYIHAGASAVPAVVTAKPGNVVTAARQAGSAVAGAGAGQAAAEAGLGTTGQIIANVAAGGVTAPRKAPTSDFAAPPENVRGVRKVLEGVAGKQSVEDLASIKNQSVVNAKAKAAIGLGKKDQLTPDALKSVRDEAGKVYEKVASAGEIQTDRTYAKQLTDMLAETTKVGKDFKGANVGANKQIGELVQTLWQDKFDARNAVDYIKQLRDDSKDNLSKFNTDPARKALGKSQRRAADILEEMVGRNLKQAGNGKLAKEWKNARELIAKTYTIEGALNPSTGNVSAAKLAKQFQKGKPLSGELKEVAAAATKTPKAFKDAAVNTSKPGFSPLDMYGGGGLGLGASLLLGDPTGLAAGLAVPAARGVARNMLLAPPKDFSGALTNASQQARMRESNVFLRPASQR